METSNLIFLIFFRSGNDFIRSGNPYSKTELYLIGNKVGQAKQKMEATGPIPSNCFFIFVLIVCVHGEVGDNWVRPVNQPPDEGAQLVKSRKNEGFC